MDHLSVIDVIRSERFTLVEIREENRLQLVNTVNTRWAQPTPKMVHERVAEHTG